jgi:hypothetical protein
MHLSLLFVMQPVSYIESTVGQQQEVVESSNVCITYDPNEKVIMITCKSANLTEINNQLKDPNVPNQETTDGCGIWLLNAGIEVAPNALLYINSTDTSWLKIGMYQIRITIEFRIQ